MRFICLAHKFKSETTEICNLMLCFQKFWERTNVPQYAPATFWDLRCLCLISMVDDINGTTLGWPLFSQPTNLVINSKANESPLYSPQCSITRNDIKSCIKEVFEEDLWFRPWPRMLLSLICDGNATKRNDSFGSRWYLMVKLMTKKMLSLCFVLLKRLEIFTFLH